MNMLYSPFNSMAILAISLSVCTNAAAADDAAQIKIGKQLFLNVVPACAICHTLKDAGSEGAVGPVLDEIKPDAQRVSKALRDGLGNMPSYKALLTEAQIAALAQYVSNASGAVK